MLFCYFASSMRLFAAYFDINASCIIKVFKTSYCIRCNHTPPPPHSMLHQTSQFSLIRCFQYIVDSTTIISKFYLYYAHILKIFGGFTL